MAKVFLDRKRVTREVGAELRLLQRGQILRVEIERDIDGDYFVDTRVEGTGVVDKQES